MSTSRRAFLVAAAAVPLSACAAPELPAPQPTTVTTTPGDPRDTSTPRALGTTYQKLVLGHAFLRDLIAVAWPPTGEPLLISLMSSKPAADAPYDQALLAEAAYLVTALP